MQDNWQDDLYNIITASDNEVPRPNDIRSKIVLMLSSKGYKAKLTSKFDIIISMKEEEYIFLKLKYQ
jgi:hypothetical protein